MKYLFIGLVLLFSGVILGVLELNETIYDTDKFVYSAHRTISIKKILAPHFITMGVIFTFTGVVSIIFSKRSNLTHKL